MSLVLPEVKIGFLAVW